MKEKALDGERQMERQTGRWRGMWEGKMGWGGGEGKEDSLKCWFTSRGSNTQGSSMVPREKEREREASTHLPHVRAQRSHAVCHPVRVPDVFCVHVFVCG